MSALSRLRMAAQPLTRLLPSKRAYGSAGAAAEYDYEDDYDCEAQRNQKRGLELDSEGWQSGRGVQWVIMGDPTTKRHVYAERLSKLLEVPHISMGTLVRQELHPHSSLYKQIANAVNQGELVPEDVIFGLLSKRLEEGYQRGETGFILDGIPRTRIQAEILDEIADIDLVVNLKCMKDSMVKEHIGGDVHPCSQEFLRMGNAGLNFSPQSPDGHIQTSGASLDGTWKEKLRIYTEQIKPLEDHYRKQRKLVDFQVAGAPGDAWHGLLVALHLRHMSAVGSSQKLTA